MHKPSEDKRERNFFYQSFICFYRRFFRFSAYRRIYWSRYCYLPMTIYIWKSIVYSSYLAFVQRLSVSLLPCLSVWLFVIMKIAANDGNYATKHWINHVIPKRETKVLFHKFFHNFTGFINESRLDYWRILVISKCHHVLLPVAADGVFGWVFHFRRHRLGVIRNTFGCRHLTVFYSISAAQRSSLATKNFQRAHRQTSQRQARSHTSGVFEFKYQVYPANQLFVPTSWGSNA